MTPYLDAEGESGKQPLDSHKYRCYAIIVHHGRSMTQVRRRDEEMKRKEEKGRGIMKRHEESKKRNMNTNLIQMHLATAHASWYMYMLQLVGPQLYVRWRTALDSVRYSVRSV